MARPFTSRLADEILKRAVEETVQGTIEEGIKQGEDANSLAKRFFRATMGRNTPLVRAARAIPGFRYALHSALTLGAEYASKHADTLFRGDARPTIVALRLALKTVGPMLAGATEAASDVLEKQINDEVDRVVSPAGAAKKKAELDWVVIVASQFGMRPFYPVKTDDDGKPIMEKKDEYDVPNVLDLEFERFRDSWLREHPAKRVSQGGGKGQPQRVENVALVVPWRILTLDEYVKMVGRHGMVSEPELAELKAHFAKPKSATDFSQKTYAVFRSYVRTQRRLQNRKERDALDGRDSESLVESCLQANVSILRVDQMVGEAFFDRIDEAGFLPDVAVQEFEDTVDMFLKGEQDAVATILRYVRDLRRQSQAGGNSLWWLSLGFLGATSLIWVPLLAMAFLFLCAGYMYIAGLLTSVDVPQTLFGRPISGKFYALITTLASGYLAFAVTWTFPVFQTMTGWIRLVFPSLREDWLVSLGRKIIAYAMLFFSGLSFYAVLLGVPVPLRLVILAVAGVGIAVAMALAEAGYRFQAEEIVSKSAKWVLFFFGALPLAAALVYGSYLGNPGQAAAVDSGMKGVAGAVAGSKWLMLCTLGLLWAAASVAVSFLEYRKVPEGAYRLPTRGLGWAMAVVAVGVVGYIFFDRFAVAKEEAKEEPASEEKAQRTPAPAKRADAPKRDSLCDDPELPYTYRRDLGCDE